MVSRVAAHVNPGRGPGCVGPARGRLRFEASDVLVLATIATFASRGATVSLACAWLFGAVDRLQLIARGRWSDGVVLTLEARVFGVQPTIWLERFTRPWLTEWMMFAYVIYIGFYPLVCLDVCRGHCRRALEKCLLALRIADVACDLGFIAFPVAGRTAFMGAAYTVPLDGWLFTQAVEFVVSG